MKDDETLCHACGVSTADSKGEIRKDISSTPTPAMSPARKVEHEKVTAPSRYKLLLGVMLIMILLAAGAYTLFHAVAPTTAPPSAPTSVSSSTVEFRIIVVIRDDDVQPYFGAASLKRLIEVLQNSNVPVTLGVIPNAGGKSPIDVDKDQLAFLQGILRNDTMFEVALHGLTHLNKTFEPTGLGYSEFAGLPLDQQTKFITQGLSILHSAFPYVTIRTFVPPFDSYDNNTLSALKDQGFTAISTDDYTEAVLYGKPPPPRNLPPTPQSPDLPTSQPFMLNGLLHFPANIETFNWTTNSFIPLETVQQRFELFYARPARTFTLLLHHWLYSTTSTHFQELQSLIYFIKGHEGIKFMTIGQFTRLYLSGQLRKAQSGWQLTSTPSHLITTIVIESYSSGFILTANRHEWLELGLTMFNH
jgi:peptidoglycan/xylan/chitin deacetylase (PgdA/CDA1 family)